MNIWNESLIPTAPKKKTSDKVPAETSSAVDSSSTTNITNRNNITIDPSKNPNQAVSAASEMNTIHPMTWSTQSQQPVHPTNPQPTWRRWGPASHEKYSDSELSEQSALADPDPEELALGDC
ncbi:hypothetical protein M422DRAFT_274767 [Sphaerobolus stellatus SS14]|uniref:Uncharacterized protein n=1 Tax=Sphaerobolus stellatus (strain SS14) TaxID=990650 RepID=A0A0C9U5T8_SPHS4|nr:hypothetical protein M422DRAFT_274767 [Sphaerobolus stellatus SS14]